MVLLRTQLNWQMLLPAAQPLTFQTTVVQVGNPALGSVPGFHTEPADSLVCSSVVNPSSGFMLAAAAGNWSFPFMWKQIAGPIPWGLLVQFFPQSRVPRELMVVHTGLSSGQDMWTSLSCCQYIKVFVLFCADKGYCSVGTWKTKRNSCEVLSPDPRSHVGNYWWQWSSPIYLESFPILGDLWIQCFLHAPDY